MLCEICRTHLNTWVKDYHFAELIELIEEYTYDDVIFFNIIPFHKKKDSIWPEKIYYGITEMEKNYVVVKHGKNYKTWGKNNHERTEMH